MRRLRKISAPMVLACCVALPLAACSGKGFAGGGSGGSDDSVNLLLVDQPTTQEMRAKWIPQFEKETGTTVNVEMVPEAGMDAKLATALSSGQSSYDVVMTGAKNWSTLVSSKWIAPLDENFAESPASYQDGFDASLLKNLAIDGKSYSMPFQVGADMLFYNKTMFTAAGLDPDDPPQTMAEIVDAAQRLTKPDGSQAGFVGRGTRNGNENSFSWIMMWFLNGGGWVGADGEEKYDVLTDEPAVKTAQQYQQLMTANAPQGASNYGFAEAQVAMQQGRAAMWLDAAQLGPALEDESASTIAGDVGYAAPSGPGDRYITGAVWGLSMVAGTQHEDDAWDLITHLTGKDVSVEQAVSGANGSPARSDALSDPKVAAAFDPEFLAALEEAIPHVNPTYTPLIPQGGEIRGALSLELSNMLSGSTDPAGAMGAANDQVRQITEKK